MVATENENRAFWAKSGPRSALRDCAMDTATRSLNAMSARDLCSTVHISPRCPCRCLTFAVPSSVLFPARGAKCNGRYGGK